MGDQGIKVCDNADAARWAIAEHRADVLDMARAVASGWGWYTETRGNVDRARFEYDCREIAHIAAAIVAAVDDELDGGDA